MSYNIHITAAAEKDLIRATDHIEFVLKNPKAADDLLNEAEKQINSLSDFPEKFQLVDDSVLASWGIRFVIVNGYLAFYTISKEENMVIVVPLPFSKEQLECHSTSRFFIGIGGVKIQ
jgi:plasmid stabilization system protein ParE